MNDPSALVERLNGVFVTTVTPFDSNGRVDYDRIAANIKHGRVHPVEPRRGFVHDSGTDVAWLCGTAEPFFHLARAAGVHPAALAA